MPNPSLDWLNDLPDLRVTRVTPVTPQKSAANPVTQADAAPVTPVTESGIVTLVTGADDSRVTQKPAEIRHVTAVTHVTRQNNGVDGLATDLFAGVEKLRTMRRPRVQRPELWDEIVRDALQIGTHWASQAIGLGWPPLHLFGCEPSSDPDTWNESLAVILSGRVIRAVDADAFHIRDGDHRILFNRRPRPSLMKFIWEI